MEQIEKKKNSGKKIKVWLPLLFSIVMIVGMFIGFKLYEHTHKTPRSSVIFKTGYSKVDEILNYIDAKYVDTVNRQELTNSGIEGILKQLDRFSNYIPPKKLKQVNESLEGEFEGIGIEFYILNDTIMVVSPISGGPSEALGIKAGDKIIKIDSLNVAGQEITNKEVIDKLRGAKGTEVEVSIKRNGYDELIDYTITRDKIPLFSVDVAYMVDDEVGYIKINRFSGKTYNEFMNALRKLKARGMEKLMLDLRDNPGGYLTAATNIVDELLSGRKLIVYTEGRAYPRYDYYARKRGDFEEGKLVVLINEGSASASEIISGAVQDWDRATVIGRRSFGKGLVQEQYNLDDGSALRLTIARYYTPTGRSIQKKEVQKKKNFEATHYKTNDSIYFNDSLKYYTPGGDTVYGGGGIYPDIIVPPDTSGINDYLMNILVKGLITQFSYDYFSDNRSSFDQFESVKDFISNFKVDNKIMNEFVDFVTEKGIQKNKDNLEESREVIETRIKASIARQKWRNEGYFPVIRAIDPTFKIAYDYIRNGPGSMQVSSE